MPSITAGPEGTVRYSIDSLAKGAWTHASLLSVPDGFAPVMTNCDVPAGVVTAMPGNGVFLDAAYAATDVACNLLCERKTTSAVTYVSANLAGQVRYWTGSAWQTLRSGFITSGYWTWTQYGTDLFLTNPTDGIWRYDGDTLVPIGAKPIAQMESDEASLWAGETADTTNFAEGLQSMYAESSGAQTTLTYTPAANFNAVAGRLSARDYETDKSPGTDFYHFKVMFSNTGTIDTTNTRVLLTDGDADTLNFPYTTWDSDRSGTTLTNPPVAGTWYDVYLPASGGTEGGTFDASNIDTFAFAVDTSSGTLRMNVDDLYVIYATTMPAMRVLGEWKNILFGIRGSSGDDIHFSLVRGPDEYSSTATFPIKTGGHALTGCATFYNQLVITTEHTVHSLSGQNLENTYPAYLFDQQMVTDEGGCSSHRSIVKAGNKLWWLYQRHIVTYNGTGIAKVSYPVDVTLASLDDANLDLCVGAPFRAKNQLWWTYRRSSQSVNDRILRHDYQEGSWLPTEGLSTPVLHRTFDSGVEKLLTVDATAGQKRVYAENHASNLTVFGTAITYTLELPPVGDITQAADWLYAVLAYLTNTGSVTVAYRIADHLRALSGASYTTLETVNQAAAGELGKIKVGDAGTLVQLRLTASGVKFQLQPPLVAFARPRGPEQVYP